MAKKQAVSIALSSAQLQAVLASFPDPVFLLTRSGVYAAVYGGTDARYYHNGDGLVGKYLHDVLKQEKADWFLAEIAIALASRQLHIVEYGLAGSDVQGLGDQGPGKTILFEGRVQALDFQLNGEDAVLWVASNITARVDVEIQLTDAMRRERAAIDILWRRMDSVRLEKTDTRWTIDVAGSRLVSANGELIALTSNEIQLLACLAEVSGAVLSKETLYARIFPGVDLAGSERLNVTLSRLRQKLNRQGSGLTIRSVFGKGLTLTEGLRVCAGGTVAGIKST